MAIKARAAVLTLLLLSPLALFLPGLPWSNLFQHKLKKIIAKAEINLVKWRGSLSGVYSSGHHHFYYLAYKCSQYAHAWWAYKNGVRHVSSGGRILLAAAGIRPGTNVTYHIRKPDSNYDELTLVSRLGANSVCVLDEEESASINLTPGSYDVFVDLHDGNISDPNNDSPAFITNWRLAGRLEVR